MLNGRSDYSLMNHRQQCRLGNKAFGWNEEQQTENRENLHPNLGEYPENGPLCSRGFGFSGPSI